MKTLCIYCRKTLHFDCAKCNLPKEERHITTKDRGTKQEKYLALFGGIKRGY